MIKGIETILVNPTILDVAFILKIENDKKYWHLSNNFTEYLIEDITNFVLNSNNDLEKHLQHRFVIKTINSYTQIGLIDIFEYNIDEKSVGCGVFICEKFRKQGFAFDAIVALTNYVFVNLQIEKIWCFVHKNNIASINLFSKVGFTQDFTHSEDDKIKLSLINKNVE